MYKQHQDPQDEMRERLRCSVIGQIGQSHGRRDLADRAIVRGVPISAFERELLDLIAEPARPLGAIGLTSSEIQQYSLLRWLEVAGRDPHRSIGLFEVECHKAVCAAIGRADDSEPGRLAIPLEILQRDLNVATAGAGGFLIDSSVNVSFSGALRARSIVRQLGVTVLSGLRGDAHVPRISGDVTAEWLTDETDTPTETQQTFGDVGLRPKTVAIYIELSRAIVKQATPAVEGLVFADLGGLLAQTVDIGVVSGSGHTGQPLGILNTDGIATFTGASLDYTALVDAQADVAIADGIINEVGLGYMTTPQVAVLLKARQRVTAGDTPLWQGAVHAGEIEGVRARSSTLMPSATMIYGDWSTMLLGEWGVLEVLTNPFANFQAGIIGMRAVWTVDAALRHKGSFTIASGIT